MGQLICKNCRYAILLVFLMYGSILCAQKKIVIVTSASYVKNITYSQLLAIYNGNITEYNNGPVSFLDHDRNTQVYKDFVKQYFNLTDEQMMQYWEKMKLEKGKRPPKFLPEGLLAKALVTIKGSISYYYEGTIPSGLTIVNVNK